MMAAGERSGKYTVQLLLPCELEVDPAALHARLREWRPDVELLGPRTLFAIPTADLPLLVHIFPAFLDTYAAELHDALTWSPAWRWAELAKACPYSIAVAMVAQRPVNHATMLLAYLAVLDGLLFSMHPAIRDRTVLHWIPAQHLLSFDQYRLLRTELGPCGPAVNIRVGRARIATGSAPHTTTTRRSPRGSEGPLGAWVADTIGLAELGLPDLQIVCDDRDQSAVVRELRDYVRSVFVGDRLDVSWVEETAMLPPLRDAITLDPD